MKWSVIICSHNRGADLCETLNAVSQLDYPPDDFEILIVDNASEDDTRMVVEAATAQMSNLLYLHEQQLGLSHARNTGIENARGELVAFLDDDAAPQPDWLKRLETCFSDRQVACAGGMVKPVWQKLSGWPDWLHPRLTGYFTVIDYPDSRPLGYPSCPAGTNVAFRKKIFAEVGVFNPQLGRTGTSLLSGEEADLCVAIEQAGYRVVYTPEAVVHHKVHENRLTRDWVLQRSHWGGVSAAILERRRFGLLNLTVKTAKYLILVVLSEFLKRFYALSQSHKEAFFWQCQALFSKAFLKHLLIDNASGNNKGTS